MSAFRSVVVFVLALALPAPVLAADDQAGMEAYLQGDYATALKEFGPLAEQGDVDFQYALGVMYSKGRGVPQDYTEAAKWFRLVAKRGDADSQYSLGVLYWQGEGVPQDYAEAAMWYRKAAKQGDGTGKGAV